MKEKIVSVLMLALILTSTLSMAFIIKPSLAESNPQNENFKEKNSKTTLPSAKQKETLEKSSETSRSPEDKWNFNGTSEWSKSAYADGNKTRLIVGVDDEKPTNLP